MTKRATNQLFALFFMILVAVIPACGSLSTDQIVDAAGGDSALADVPADVEAVLLDETTSTGNIAGDFTPETAALIASSVIDLPKSLADETSSNHDSKTKSEIEGDDGSNFRRSSHPVDTESIFTGIHKFIGTAEDFKSEGVDILVRTIPKLTTATIGEEFILKENVRDHGDPRRVLIERDRHYNWRVSFFFTSTGLDPEMIVRFTLAGDGVIGLILRGTEDADNDNDTAAVPATLAVRFNGVSNTKTVEIKLHRDFTGLRSWVDDNISDLSSSDLYDLDLGDPDKVFVNASLDTGLREYTVHGATYHPGWEALRDLGSTESPVWETGRNVYLFKAKALEPVDDETTSDTDVTEVTDVTDVTDVTEVTDVTDVTEVTEVTGAKLFLALPLDTVTDVTTVWDDDSIAVHFESSMLAKLNSEIAEDDNGLDTFRLVIDDSEIDEIRDITLSEFGEFLSRDSDDSDLTTLQEDYMSVKSTLNPAFYTGHDRFIGTYDEVGEVYWGYKDSLVSESTDDDFIDTIDSLNSFDLTGIVPYVPATIVGATITVE